MRDYSDTKIPFALKRDLLVGVEEVSSGLACDCVCPCCFGRLQAKKGDKNAHHFSHDPSADERECRNAFETSIHLMAKQILLEEKRIRLPSLEPKVSGYDLSGKAYVVSELVCEKVDQQFERVDVERAVSDFRPDVIGFVDGLPLLIEIAVTHFVDPGKMKKIRKGGYRAIEVDLSKVADSITKDQLKDLVVHKESNKKWLSHESASGIKTRLKIQLEGRIREADKAFLKSRNRGKKTTSSRIKFRSIQPLVPASVPPSPPVEYDLRWIKCDKCSNLWKTSKSETPYSLRLIDCPRCGHQVSTARV
ncbi:MAG: hypothetical protein V7742_21650 [Halioglobus sp.]